MPTSKRRLGHQLPAWPKPPFILHVTTPFPLPALSPRSSLLHTGLHADAFRTQAMWNHLVQQHLGFLGLRVWATARVLAAQLPVLAVFVSAGWAAWNRTSNVATSQDSYRRLCQHSAGSCCLAVHGVLTNWLGKSALQSHMCNARSSLRSVPGCPHCPANTAKHHVAYGSFWSADTSAATIEMNDCEHATSWWS